MPGKRICFIRRLVAFTLLLACPAVGLLAQSMDYSPGFRAGPPAELAALDFLPGAYDVALYFPSAAANGKQEWQPWASTSAEIRPVLGGAFLLEENRGFPIAANAIGADGISDWSFMAVWSYDRFNQRYRASISDNVLALTDIYEGHFEAESLVLSNLNTDTYNNMGSNGDRQKNRIILGRDPEAGFVITWYTLDVSQIKGSDVAAQAWVPSVKMHYRPRAD